MPFPVGAAIMGGSALLGTVANSYFQNQANNIAQKQFRESMNMQKYQYEDMKRYNSPENQVSMMRRAGINPALAYYGGSSPSTVSSTGSPSPNAQFQPLNFNGLQSAFQGLQGDINQTSLIPSEVRKNESESGKNDVEAGLYAIDKLTRNEENLARIYNINSDSWLKDKNSELVRTNFEFLNRSMQNRLDEQRYNTWARKAELQSSLIANTFAPDKYRAEIDLLVKQAALSVQQGVATIQQAHAALMSSKAVKASYDAQFGSNKDERQQFFNSTLKLLQWSSEEKSANTYDKLYTSNPIPPNYYKYGDWFRFKSGTGRHSTGYYQTHQ